MKHIKIADTTLCRTEGAFGFKEKLEIARQLEKLCVDVIELPEIVNAKTDILLVRTMSSFVRNATVSVAAGSTPESIDNALTALGAAAHPQIRIELPLSAVGMEYISHRKPDKMLAWISEAVKTAKAGCENVEFCAMDATRSETEFLKQAIAAAAQAGATGISVCDSASKMLPDDFAAFAADIAAFAGVPLTVGYNDQNGLAIAAAIMAVRAGAENIKTCIEGNDVDLERFADMVRNCGNTYDFDCGISGTELHRVVKQIRWIAGNAKNEHSAVTVSTVDESGICLDEKDDENALSTAVSMLGYDLSVDDLAKVYEEFLNVVATKKVGAKELEAIIASVALQVPSTFKLVNYIINNGNIISSSAQITLSKDGEMMQGVCLGDGPIDAAFLAIDQIIGHHYELDDFQIQSVTEGKEAMGSAIVKLRAGGKLYSGNGISTDIIGASIRAYINAVNKIVYEEA